MPHKWVNNYTTRYTVKNLLNGVFLCKKHIDFISVMYYNLLEYVLYYLIIKGKNMRDFFENVLDSGEQISYTFKPNKTKVIFANLMLIIPILLFFCAGMAVAMFVPEEGYEPLEPIFAIIPAAFFLLGIVVSVFLTNLWIKKTVYAVTEKRIIIRTGIIGVDFKSLDIDSIGALEVYVSIFDKILGGKTGTIKFGSMSSPINGQNGTGYAFSSIEAPYKNYKTIKEHIQTSKENKKI